MEKYLAAWGCVAGLLAVALGAFGAHALKGRLGPDMLAVFEIGVRYQMYHALALLAAAWAAGRFAPGLAGAAGALFGAGIVVFSGSLYALALTGARMWGAATPFGGLMFLAGWACLAASALKG